MKASLFRDLLLALFFGFVGPLCLAYASTSYGKISAQKFDRDLAQQNQAQDSKKKSPQENKGSNAEQAKKARGADAEADTIRIETNLVVFDVLVLAPNGSAVTGLKQEDFEVFEEGQPQQLGTFALGDGSVIPRMIILIIDHSVSQFPYIKDSVEAAKVLVDKLKPADRMALVTDNIQVLVPFTEDKARLKKGLDFLAAQAKAGRRGMSKQISALHSTLRDLDTREGRPIIVLQSDGDEIDNLNEASLAEVFSTVDKAQATIYTIIPGLRLLQLPREEQLKNLDSMIRQEQAALVEQGFPRGYMADRLGSGWNPSTKEYERLLAHRMREHNALLGISTLSGGWTSYLEKPSLAGDIYARLFTSIEQRYILGYYPSNSPAEGQRRPVEIKVRNHPEYKIVRRKAYYKLGRPKPR